MRERPQAPRPLTGRMVLLILLVFFGVVISVNVTMMKLAITTLPGTDVDSAYSASIGYEKEIVAAHDQTSRNWQVEAHIERDRNGGAPAVGGPRCRSRRTTPVASRSPASPFRGVWSDRPTSGRISPWRWQKSEAASIA